ncbi:MAG: hypothetical protein JWQ74_389 [Marmoricola sp.]|nr:hypothetical protein [Marmoricola sp.]
MTPQTRLAAFAVLLTASLALTGCGSDTKTVKLGDGSTVKVTGDGEGATIEGKDGTKITTGKGLPDGYPTSDVPVVDGKVVGAATNSGDIAYSVIVQTTGSTADVFAAATAKLTGAGMTNKGEPSDLGPASFAQFTSDKYEVALTVANGNGNTIVTYAVKNAG